MAAYTINLTNGSALIPNGLQDGTINTSATSLTLIGRDYAGYGSFLNENFVYLLENFADTTSPANPLRGQLWWDTANNILRVYSGTSWKISTGATSAPFSSPPSDLSALGGDLWFDSTNQQLKLWSGTQWIVIGPLATAATTGTGAIPAVMLDTSAGTHIVVQFSIAGVIYAIFSKDSFSSTTPGFTTVQAGLNFSTIASPTLGLNTQATAATASTLVLRDTSGGITVNNINAAGAITAPSASVTGTVAATSFTGNLTGNVTGSGVNSTTITGSLFNIASGGTGYYGTLMTAAQPNITSVGVINNLNATGATVLTGTALLNGQPIATELNNVSFTAINNTVIGNTGPASGTFSTIQTGGNITPLANTSISLGNVSYYWGSLYSQNVNVLSNVNTGSLNSVNSYATVSVNAPTVNAPTINSSNVNASYGVFGSGVNAPAIFGTTIGSSTLNANLINVTTANVTTLGVTGNIGASYGNFTGVNAIAGAVNAGTVGATTVNTTTLNTTNILATGTFSASSTGSFGGKVSMTSGSTGFATSSSLNVYGDITTARSSTTGTIYLGTGGTSYLSYDGTNYNLPTGGLNIGGSIVPSANVSYNLGSSANWWNLVYGTAVHAQYADLAERYEADAVYTPGTLVEIGGENEITLCDEELSETVFGVISTDPAYLMNGGAGSDETHPPVALAGRVPVRVVGPVTKGQRLVSAGNGCARGVAADEASTFNVIGRSLVNKRSLEEELIEAVVTIK